MGLGILTRIVISCSKTAKPTGCLVGRLAEATAKAGVPKPGHTGQWVMALRWARGGDEEVRVGRESSRPSDDVAEIDNQGCIRGNGLVVVEDRSGSASGK